MENNNENNVILIAGTINATNKMLYWKSDREISIGDYVVVENANGYDLIKIVGIVETTEKNASKFSNTKYENIKRVITVIQKELIEM